MERTLQYPITDADSGCTIGQYLKKRGFSGQSLTQLKKYTDGIQKNGSPAYVVHRLEAGDLLTVHIRETASSEKIPPVPLPLSLVYEDEDLLVVNKPAGMPIHPSMHNYENSLGNALAYYFSCQHIPFVFRCINRLDRDTTGLTIVAKHFVSAGILSQMVARREIHREYLALVRSRSPFQAPPLPAGGTIRAPLGRKPGSVIERVVDWEAGESAVTHYRILEEKNGHYLLSLHLETGRTHQIRIHARYLGYPLIGDYLYHPDMEWIGRQALHSYRLSFSHPITQEPLTFTAPLPEDMQRVLNGVR